MHNSLIASLTPLGLWELVMVMVLITYYNSYIQLNYHMFTRNIRTITTILNLNIHLHCQFFFYINILEVSRYFKANRNIEIHSRVLVNALIIFGYRKYNWATLKTFCSTIKIVNFLST